MKKYAFGVDIGGTTIKIGLFETTGKLLAKWEIPTRTEENGTYILNDIAEAVAAKLAEEGISEKEVEGIGVGVLLVVTEVAFVAIPPGGRRKPQVVQATLEQMGFTGAIRPASEFRRGRSGKNGLSAIFGNAGQISAGAELRPQRLVWAKQLAPRHHQEAVTQQRPISHAHPVKDQQINLLDLRILQQWLNRRFHDIAVQPRPAGSCRELALV